LDEIMEHKKQHEQEQQAKIESTHTGIGGIHELEREYEKQQHKISVKTEQLNKLNPNNSTEDNTTTQNTTQNNNNTSGTRTRYLCEECDKYYLFTPPEILRHKKTHAA